MTLITVIVLSFILSRIFEYIIKAEFEVAYVDWISAAVFNKIILLQKNLIEVKIQIIRITLIDIEIVYGVLVLVYY